MRDIALHEAMRLMLAQSDNSEMNIDELAQENERQQLYTKRDGDYPDSKQFAMRAMNYPEFEVIVRLRR